MSYDLYFNPRQPDAKLTAASFSDYFRQRKKYEVSEKQAIYQNEDTGVYFIFDLGAPEDEEPGEQSLLSLNLNYLRPHVFGLEAEVEVSALVRKFNLLVGDPQDYMSDGEYSSDGFLRGWNHGNEFGTRAYLNDKEFNDSIFAAPAAKLEAAWRWNFAKAALQEQFGENIFVPTIMWVARNGCAETTVVWGDGMPMAIPEVDAVFIPRDEFAPKKLFRKKPDISLATWSEVEPLIAEFPLETSSLPYRVLGYTEVPPHIIEFVKGRNAMSGNPDIVPLDKVLDLELVEKAKQNK